MSVTTVFLRFHSITGRERNVYSCLHWCEIPITSLRCFSSRLTELSGSLTLVVSLILSPRLWTSLTACSSLSFADILLILLIFLHWWKFRLQLLEVFFIYCQATYTSAFFMSALVEVMSQFLRKKTIHDIQRTSWSTFQYVYKSFISYNQAIVLWSGMLSIRQSCMSAFSTVLLLVEAFYRLSTASTSWDWVIWEWSRHTATVFKKELRWTPCTWWLQQQVNVVRVMQIMQPGY